MLRNYSKTITKPTMKHTVSMLWEKGCWGEIPYPGILWRNRRGSWCLHVCAGHIADAAASINGMSQIFAEEETDAILLIDARNAFNQLNRSVAMHNIQITCPLMSVSSILLIPGGYHARWVTYHRRVPPRWPFGYALVFHQYIRLDRKSDYFLIRC